MLLGIRNIASAKSEAVFDSEIPSWLLLDTKLITLFSYFALVQVVKQHQDFQSLFWLKSLSKLSVQEILIFFGT